MRNDGLLTALQTGGRFVSGSGLARRLGLTRAAVHKRVEKLRAAGHRVRGATRRGYRWEGSEGAFDVSLLKGHLASSVSRFSVLGSTQDEAKARALAEAEAGTLVIADRQTAGRGRLGRRWASPAGGLWFSLVLRPRIPPDRAPALALVAALDWAEVLALRGVPARVKWPNDVWAEGRKIAGILTEMSAEADRVHWLVLGVGVNVNNRPPRGAATPAGAVRDWAGPVRRDEILAEWLARFERSCRRFAREGFRPFRHLYARRSVLAAGTRVSFADAEGPGAGRVLGVDDAGRLRLAARGGAVVFSGGEVNLIRPASGKEPA